MADDVGGTKSGAKDSSPLAVGGEALQSERGGSELPGGISGPLVASPTGLVPLSATVNDPKKAAKVRKERVKRLQEEEDHPRSGRVLTKDEVERMSGAELRAVAFDRGYEAKGGRRLSAERFLAMQDEDESLEDGPRQRGRKRA